jgi:pyrroline-5-carboxylate reductase
MKVGFIGMGEIAEALVEGIVGNGHEISISRRNSVRAEKLSHAYNEIVCCSNEEVVSNSDIIFVCLMSPVAEQELPKLKFKGHHHIISVMANTSRKQLMDLCFPSNNIYITIPLPFIAKGGCPLPVFPSCRALDNLYGENNSIIVVNRAEDIAAYFAISATLSPIFTLFEVAADWLTDKTEDNLSAEVYVTQLFKGYLDFMPNGERKRFQVALKSLSTEGGLNSTLKAFMSQNNTYKIFEDGLDSLRQRLGITN